MPWRAVIYADNTTLVNQDDNIEGLLSQENLAMEAALEQIKSNCFQTIK